MYRRALARKAALLFAVTLLLSAVAGCGNGAGDSRAAGENGSDAAQRRNGAGNENVEEAVRELEELGRDARRTIRSAADTLGEQVDTAEVREQIETIVSETKNRLIVLREEAQQGAQNVGERVEQAAREGRQRIEAIIDSVTATE
jgi:ElaB/YqjD/DUF883 family membrane-anchored ribosome-binding protein